MKQIQELAKQSHCYNQSLYDNGEGGWIIRDTELMNFAALIMAECAARAAEYFNSASLQAEYDIQEYLQLHT